MICTKCNKHKPVNEANWNLKKDGTRRFSVCRDCNRTYKRLWQQSHKAKLNERRRTRARGRGVQPSTHRVDGDMFARLTANQLAILHSKIGRSEPLTKTADTFVTSNLVRGRTSV